MNTTTKHRPMLNGVVRECAQSPYAAMTEPRLEAELSSLVDEIHKAAEAIVRSRGGRFAVRIIAVEEATSGGQKLDLARSPVACETDAYVFRKMGRDTGESWWGLKKIYTY